MDMHFFARAPKDMHSCHAPNQNYPATPLLNSHTHIDRVVGRSISFSIHKRPLRQSTGASELHMAIWLRAWMPCNSVSISCLPSVSVRRRVLRRVLSSGDPRSTSNRILPRENIDVRLKPLEAHEAMSCALTSCRARHTGNWIRPNDWLSQFVRRVCSE